MENFKNILDENFSYGYDGLLYNIRSSRDSIFQCHYRKATRRPESFRNECIRICHKIADYAESVDRIPTILLSGGLDSETVVRAFLDSGRKFETVVNRFSDDLNSHEIEYVDKFLKSKNLNANFVDMDVEKWIQSNEALQMAEDSKCPYSEMLPTMKLIDQVYNEMKGIPVLGNGDFYARQIEDQWMYIEYEYILAWMRYCVKKKIVGSINFFQQTPEVVLAMGLDPMISDTVEKSQEPNLRFTKYKIYQKHWSDSEIRMKYNGAEKIQDICDRVNQYHLKKYSAYTSKWMMPLEKFLLDMSVEVHLDQEI